MAFPQAMAAALGLLLMGQQAYSALARTAFPWTLALPEAMGLTEAVPLHREMAAFLIPASHSVKAALTAFFGRDGIQAVWALAAFAC